MREVTVPFWFWKIPFSHKRRSTVKEVLFFQPSSRRLSWASWPEEMGSLFQMISAKRDSMAPMVRSCMDKTSLVYIV